MATGTRLRKFAEQALRVERVLNQQRVTGSPGKVVYLLTLADRIAGVAQMDVIADAPLSKDAVSKLVGSLVAAGLLIQKREASDPRSKRLAITSAGRELLRRLETEIQPPGPRPKEAEAQVRPGGFIFEE